MPRPPRVSTPADIERQNELFRDAGLEDAAAVAAGKDPGAAASVIARRHPQAVVRLMGAAFARGSDADLLAARRVAERLHDKGAKLIDIFRKSKTRKDDVVLRCARIVGEVAGKGALERLRALVKEDPSPVVRAAAFAGLAKGLEADGLGQLAREVVASETEAPEVRAAALEAIGEARAIGAAALCALVIHDGNADVRKAATRALQRMGPTAIPAILEDVRARGQQTIGLQVDTVKAILGSADLTGVPADLLDQARKIYVNALRDTSTPVRWAAAAALGTIGGQDEFAPLDEACTFEKNEIAKANMECARAELKKRIAT